MKELLPACPILLGIIAACTVIDGLDGRYVNWVEIALGVVTGLNAVVAYAVSNIEERRINDLKDAYALEKRIEALERSAR